MISFTIPGNPVSKARPRITRFATYTPEKTVNYEAMVKLIAEQNSDVYYEDEALKVTIIAYFQIPRGTSKKKKIEMLNGTIRPAKRPDADNLAKIILDPMNGIIYKDDSQVVELICYKKYAEIPQVDVTIDIV